MVVFLPHLMHANGIHLSLKFSSDGHGFTKGNSIIYQRIALLDALALPSHTQRFINHCSTPDLCYLRKEANLAENSSYYIYSIKECSLLKPHTLPEINRPYSKTILHPFKMIYDI